MEEDMEVKNVKWKQLWDVASFKHKSIFLLKIYLKKIIINKHNVHILILTIFEIEKNF